MNSGTGLQVFSYNYFVGSLILVRFCKATAFDLNVNQLGETSSNEYAAAWFQRKSKLRQGFMKMKNLARPHRNCRAQSCGKISLQVAKSWSAAICEILAKSQKKTLAQSKLKDFQEGEMMIGKSLWVTNGAT